MKSAAFSTDNSNSYNHHTVFDSNGRTATVTYPSDNVADCDCNTYGCLTEVVDNFSGAATGPQTRATRNCAKIGWH
jgi:hypothetical protein